MDAATPLPTPWAKEAFEAESKEVQKKRRQIRADRRPEAEMDALFVQEKQAETQLLSADRYAGKVGAFEGALYEGKGYYRPQSDCVMFSRDDVPFCAVCQRAIGQVIDLYAGPKPSGPAR